MRTSVLAVLILLLPQCAPDRDISKLSDSEQEELASFIQLNKKNRVEIADENEPGQKLMICLRLIDKATKAVLTDQKIAFYHTSLDGDYEPSDLGDESTARLNGHGYTDREGRIFVTTILPGDYGSSEDNRHIHTTVSNAKPVAYDIHFKQYTGFMGKNFIEGSDQHFLADLKYTEDSTLVTFITIEVKSPVQ